MPLWSNAANTLDAPKFRPLAGSNVHGNAMLGNTTVGAYKTNEAVGVFGVDNANVENITGVYAPGWQLAIHGTGPIKTVTVGNGSNFVNGETFTVTGNISGDTVANATGYFTVNATGNLVSATLTYGGTGFANVLATNAYFNRDQHLTNILFRNNEVVTSVTNSAGKYVSSIYQTGTATGYNNTDYAVVSNSANYVNALFTLATNSTGGTVVFTPSRYGTFAGATTNTQTVVTVYAANGAATNGTGLTLQGNLTSAIIGYANTDYVLISNGTVNATANIATNSTGGTLTFTVNAVGVFAYNQTNTALVVVAYAANGTLSNGGGAILTANLVNAVPINFNNTDFVVVSNGTVNGYANISTNATGGTIVVTVNATTLGVFSNALTNAQAVVTVFAANGAISNGSNVSYMANLATSSGGYVGVATVGGRANRVTYEPLVTLHMSNTSTPVMGQ